jgi:hypothetical protein
MVLPERVFDFKDVEEGKVVEHAFRVLNKGDQPLQITNVNPGWGCAVASFDRFIPPGGEGKITLKFNTRAYEGKVRKAARVYTNDPKNPHETLVFDAVVKTPIVLSDRMVLLQGTTQETITKSVDIKGELNKPLKLEPVDYTLDKKVKFNIEEITQGKQYRVTFTSIPNVGNYYQGTLKLRTSYPEKPELVIFVRGRFLN